MKRLTRTLLAVTLAGTISFNPAAFTSDQSHTVTVSAHSGRTDSSGGHRDNRNASGLGSYHYHCGGYPAHLHENGVCPYTSAADNPDSTGSVSKNTGSSSDSNTADRKTVRKVQKKLNELGYSCGTPDGIMGSKTKRALKNFQKDNGLKADGIIGKKTLKALELN